MKKSFLRRHLPAMLFGSVLLAAPLTPAYAQWQWASTTQTVAAGANVTARAEASATDAAGDVYVTGAYQGSVQFGSTTLTSLGSTQDVFVAKLDGATGAWLWAVGGAGPGADSGFGIATDNLGNVFVTGQFESPSVQFLPLPSLSGAGALDVFVAQFNAATGVAIANVSGGGIKNDVGRSIAYHAGSASLYVTGEYHSTTALFGSPITNTVALGTSDLFVAQLNASALAWAGPTVTVGGPDDEIANGVAVNGAGAVFITGGYASPVIAFGANPPLINSGGASTTGAPNPDIFVAKSTAALGVWLWSKTAGGVGRDIGQDISINTTGHVITTGGFERAPASFPPIVFAASGTGIDAYVARMDPAIGTWQWVRQGGGLTDDGGLAISHDAAGSIYITGAFRSITAQFGATILTNFTPSGFSADVFVSKLNNAGAWIWTRQAGGMRDETGRGLAVNSLGGVFVCGEYSSTPAVFPPFPLTPVFFAEAFVARIPGILNNLIVNISPQPIPAGGAYNNITVTATGQAVLLGPLYAAGSVVVQSGGVWTSNCNILSGPGTFNLNAGGLINICSPQGISLVGPTGDIQVTGLRTFNTNADYSYVNPGTPQISGLGLTGARNLTIVNSGGVSLSGPSYVRRLLTFVPGSGNLTMTSLLVMRSALTQTSMIINSSVAVGVTGTNGLHQRIVDGTFSPGGGYRNISSPMIGSVVADLACPGFTPVLNPLFDAQFNPTPVPFPNVYGYDETLKPGFPNFGYGYYSPINLLAPLTPGTAVEAYMTSNRLPTFRGQFQNGTVTVGPLSLTGPWTGPGQKSGWHLLGNPYPSPIDWDGAVIPAGMSPTIYYWRSTGGITGSYLSFMAGAGAGQFLPTGQGFFARVTGAGVSFAFTNALRPTVYIGPNSFFSRPAPATQPEARLTLRAAGAAPELADEARIGFDASATAAATDRADSERPGHNIGQPTLMSLTPDGTELGHNVLPEASLATGLTVPLLLDLPAAGSYELAAATLANLAGTSVELLDRLTGTRYDLAAQPLVTFTAAQAGEDRTRFALVFGQRVTGVAADVAAATSLVLAPNPARGSVRVTLTPGTNGRVELLDATGRVVRREAALTGTATFDLTALPAGVYVVRAGTATRRLVVE